MQHIELRREFLSIANFVLKQNPRTIDDVMIARLKWAEQEPLRPGLIQLEDKLWQRTLARKAEVECPKLIASFGPNANADELYNILSNVDRSVIIKPTHLLAGLGVIIVSSLGKISFPKPSGPGSKKMREWQANHIGILQSENHKGKEERLYVVAEFSIEMLNLKADITEAKPLRQITPHIMIEELVDVKSEVRVLTVFGHVIGAASDNDKNYAISNEMKEAAMSLAREVRADCFRCDFFILTNQRFVLNECCSFLWPSDNFFATDIYNTAYQKLMNSYFKITAPMLEVLLMDQYVWKVTQNYASCEIGDPRYMTLLCNFYFVFGTEEIVFIDAGCGIDIFSVLNLFGGKHIGKSITCTFTHWHDDHIFGLQSLPAKTKLVTACVHHADADKIRKQLPNIPIKNLVDGETIILGNISLKIHSTPGHTKGSITVTSNKSHIFTGDAFNVGQDLMFVADSDAFMR